MNYIFLDAEDIREIHEEAIINYGGIASERESGMIEYMADKPFMESYGQELYPGLFLKSAVYLEGFATHQYFNDGNKRTGVACALTFLLINGYQLLVDEMELYKIAIDVANEIIHLHELSQWLEENSSPL